MAAPRFGILGPLEVLGPDGEVPVPFPQLRRLLCRFLLTPGKNVARSALHECLWPADGTDEAGPADPAGTLRLYLSRLRHTLPDGACLATGSGGLRLDVAPQDVDVTRFEALLAKGSEMLGSDPHEAVTPIRDALALWRGEALEEFREEPWALPSAVRLDELRLVAFERLHEAQLANGLHVEAAGELQRLVDSNPMRERFSAQLMLALYRSGRQAEALRAYTRLREHLAEELGIDPSPALTALESQILLQDPALDVVAAPLVVNPSPAPRARGHNLPGERTSFVGRERDIVLVDEMLSSSRLVTLAGPPGAGKTRLALQLAAPLAETYRAGAWFVELAGVTDPADVRPAVAATLGIPLRAGETDDIETALGTGHLLLVLDNCEHLLDACAQLCEALLGACPGVTVLATSREPLRTDGEALYRVAPLDVPAEDEDDVVRIGTADATKLFVSRAKSHLPSFELDHANAADVARLCRRLDGIPLALEMAAARLRVLSLPQILDRLETRFRLLVHGAVARWPHQQTLETLTAWSYDLLSTEDRILLQRLAIFAPGFDIDAASALLGGLGDERDVLEALSSLVDKSLLAAETGGAVARYRMLETVRQYALDRLREADGPEGIARIRDAHAALYLARAEQSQPKHLSVEQFAWLERTTLDYDNLRAAVAHFTAGAGGLQAARLLVALRHFFAWRGRRPEMAAAIAALGDRPELRATDLLTARYQMERLNQLGQTDPLAALAGLQELMGVLPTLPDRGLEAEAHNRAATLYYVTGEPQKAMELRDKALALARESGDHAALLICLLGVGGALDEVTEAVERALDVGDVFCGYYALNFLGTLVFDENLPGARDYFEQALELTRESGLAGLDYLAMSNLGHALAQLGERDRARELLGRGYDEARRHRDHRAVHFALFSLAECATLSAEYALAATVLGACDKHSERSGFKLTADLEAERVALEARVREKIGDRTFDAARRAGRVMSRDGAVDLAAHRAAHTLQLLESV